MQPNQQKKTFNKPTTKTYESFTKTNNNIQQEANTKSNKGPNWEIAQLLQTVDSHVKNK